MNGERCCYMTWRIPEGVFSYFKAKTGLHAEIGTGAVEFQVLLDGNPVWSSGRMTLESDAQNCSVALGHATSVTLKVLDANEGHSFWKNHAYWGEPELHRE